MGVPHTSGAFGDLVDKRVTRLFFDQYDELEDMIPTVFNVGSSSDQYETWSSLGALQDFEEFTGSVGYQSQSQGYDVTARHVEYASGIQIERALYDDDRHNVWSQRPKALAMAASRTRQAHAARIFNMAFSVDTKFYNNSEGVSLCSNSHTTTSGASTASGFDNLITAAFSAVAVAAARTQMINFRDDSANKIQMTPDELWYPPDLYEIAYEIMQSSGKPDTANNNVNVHKGKYTGYEWIYMNDTNNWFMCDSGMRKLFLHWFDRVKLEFAFAEEIDNIVAKWRAYMRYSWMWNDWRFILGAQVS